MRTRYKIGLLTIVLTALQLPSVSASETTAGTIGAYAGLVVGSAILAIVLVYAVVVGLALTKRILQGPATDTKK